MASALRSLANASVVFTVPSIGMKTDPDTGNVTAATATVTVSLFLKAEKISSTALPGVDVFDTLYEGYAVDPTTIDNGVVPGSEGVLTFGNEDPVSCEVISLRAPYGDTGLLGTTLNAVLGEKVQLLAKGQR